jgi:hypothetical protein
MKQDTSSISRVRVLALCLGLFAIVVIAPAAFLSGGSNSNAAIGAAPAQIVVGGGGTKESAGMYGGRSYKNDVSPPLANMPQLPVVQRPEHEAAENAKIPHNHVNKPDPVVQNFLAPDVMPATILNFDGIPFPGVACNCAPPDTDGEVGLTQYVQMVNEGYQVFNKATGASVLGPSDIQTIWQGFGGACETGGSGDPVVLYDQIANRWLISQFATATGGNPITDECIAVSTTNDATGTYNRYGFHLGSNLFEYPHIGLWPDPANNGYFMSDNVFNSSGTGFLGTQAFAFDRAAMLIGAVATFVTPGLTTGGAANEAFLPADLDGSTLPPAGSPCPYVEFPDGGNGNTYRTWLFHPDFVTPAMSTFVQRTSPAAAGYTAICPATRACVPQPAGTAVDAIGDRLMFRLPYRVIGGVERIMGNYTVSSGGVAGIRWFELRNVTSGSETVVQESTYQPDTVWRWMGSLAQDQSGDMALGFSASNASTFPSVRYAGRLVGDPVNTLGQGEAVLFAGLGSQTGSGSRWGDYSDMTIDPVDDCTFWYTQEYYPAGTTSFNWRTRIGNFKFPTCGGGAGVPVLASAGATLVSESCTPANGVLDPNEQVTVSFCIQNVGSANTVNLVGTLQNTGGVTSAGPPANYGVVVAGGPAVCRNFTFVVGNVACGSTVTATIHFQDGATDLGNITYTFQTGVQNVIFTQNFDGVAAPALPAGWVTSFTNGDGDCTVGGPLCTLATNWTTVSTSSDTAPNSAFHNDPSCVTDNLLDTPSINIPAAAAQLMFRHQYTLESTFDGGVLEISINGGAFTDIVTAGGSFVTGGYNATISGIFLSPIANRMAWSGSSGGYITTTVNLPAAAQGQPIKLRWRFASDCSGSSTGWNVDTIKITGGFVCSTTCSVLPCTAITCPANITKSNDPNQCGAVVTYPAPTPVGTGCGTITCSPASGSFFPVGTTTVTCTTAAGPSCTFTVTVNDTQPPTITCPSNQSVTSTVPPAVNYPPPTASDNCPGVASSCNPASGSVFGFGTTTVTCTATDTSSNNASCTFTVTVSPCTISCPENLATTTLPNSTQCGKSVTYPPPTVPAGCGPAVCTPASGSFFAVGSTTVTCSIPGGANCSFTVTVLDDAPPRVTCPDTVVANAAPGQSSAVVNYPAAVVTDNCPGATVQCSPPSGSRFPVGTTVASCTATDTFGNSAGCVFTVLVFDQEAPVIRCPANVNVPTQSGQTSAVVTYPPPTVSDNAPGVTVACTPASGMSFPLGVTTVTCVATDAAGNKSSCSFTAGVGGPQVKVIIPGSAAAIEFGNPFAVAPVRKPLKTKNNPCRSFAIQNIGFAPLVLTFDSVTRTGSDVALQKIGDANDTRYFTLSLVAADESSTPIDFGAVVTIQPGAAQSFCLRFSALIPALAGRTTSVAAANALPDTVTSTLTFSQNAGSPVSVSVLAHIATAVVFINGTNPRQPPTIGFTRSGNDLIVSYQLYDSNLDVSRAKYEFLDSGGQVVGPAFEIDLAEQIRAAGLVRGQSFAVEQRFTSDTPHPEIVGVRVTVFDGETSTTQSAAAASVTSTVRLLDRTGEEKLFLPAIRLNATLP